MQCDLFSHFRCDDPAAAMDVTNGVEQIFADAVLQQIAARPGLECAQGLGVAGVGGQHDDQGVGVEHTDAFDSLDAIDARHLNVHQGQVGAMAGEGLDGRQAVGDLVDDDHVRLSLDETDDPLSHDGMVICDEDADAGNDAGVDWSLYC